MHDLEDSARAHLRARTAQVHARLDRLPVFEPILAGRADWPGYLRLLVAYHGFYTCARRNLHAGYRQLLALGVDAPDRDPVALLAADLLACGATVVPDPGMEPAPATPAQAVGWVWVAEGSALGGRVIDRALDALFGARREGRRFFEPLSDSGLRWRHVCASMEDYGSHRDALESMAQGAQDAFACIERCLIHAHDDA